MKQIIAFTMLTMLSLSVHAAPAESKLRADFTYIDLDDKSHLVNMDINEGYVEITKKEVVVTLRGVFYCTPNAKCALVVPEDIIFSAELKSKTVGSCGEVIYKALTDETPVDGYRVEIKVTDTSKLKCPSVRVVPTDVEMTVTGPNMRRMVTYNHQFWGEKLKKVRTKKQ